MGESAVLDAADSVGGDQYEFAKDADSSFRDPRSEEVTTIRYLEPGTYRPRVRVTDAAGRTDTASCGSITVTETEETPTATQAASATPSTTATRTPTATATAVPTATVSRTATAVPTATTTLSPTVTPVPTATTQTEQVTNDSGTARTVDAGANGTDLRTTVEATPSPTSEVRATTTTEGPGFGVLALVGAFAVALVIRRTRRGDE